MVPVRNLRGIYMLKCPKCGYIFEAHTNLTSTKTTPPEGDILVCINCGAVLQYIRGQAVELPDEEYTKLSLETQFEIRDVVNAVHSIRGK